MHKALTLIVAIFVAASFISCDKAPNGVIKESKMSHLIADLAKAEVLIEQNPGLFPDDSSKLALKQSILKKYDADLEMYDSSLVWYAHNLKTYTQVHDKAIEILEKESNSKSSQTSGGSPVTVTGQPGGSSKHVYPTSGDSANVWKEPQQWLITNALRNGYITFDYKPDKDNKRGDKYTLGFKMLNGGNSVTLMLAIDYKDGCTSYSNRTAHVNGWSDYSIQADTSRVATRIYGYIKYNTKPHCVTFIDSIYMIRTHFDQTNYVTPAQRLAGPKAVIEKEEKDDISSNNAPQATPSNPDRPAIIRPDVPANAPQGTYKPKPGLNKSVIPSHKRAPNPNGAHLPNPPIK